MWRDSSSFWPTSTHSSPRISSTEGTCAPQPWLGRPPPPWECALEASAAMCASTLRTPIADTSGLHRDWLRWPLPRPPAMAAPRSCSVEAAEPERVPGTWSDWRLTTGAAPPTRLGGVWLWPWDCRGVCAEERPLPPLPAALPLSRRAEAPAAGSICKCASSARPFPPPPLAPALAPAPTPTFRGAKKLVLLLALAPLLPDPGAPAAVDVPAAHGAV